MNAIQFIKAHGVDKARGVVDGAPHWPVIGWCAVGNNYIFKQCEHAPCSYSNLDNAWSEEYAIELILLDDLKRLVESVGLIESYKGIDEARWYVKRWFKLHSACKQVANAKTYITDQLSALQQAIADYEQIFGNTETLGGEHV